MKVITCASYYGTGSSAVTDYLSEFDQIYSLTDYEFRFIQDIDGLADLEYYLVDNHNRHNAGHALKRFKRLTDFNAGTKFNARYEPFFNNKYKELSYEYIDELTDFKYHGYWFYDFYDKGKEYYYLKMLLTKIKRKFHIGRNYTDAFPNEITYCSKPTRDKFIKCSKKYINSLLLEANKTKKPYIMVDQLVPPSNISRYTKFFDDIRVVVVDRDPRDIYILSKYIWKDGIVPTEDLELFCKWFEYTRKHRKDEKYDESTTMLINFEDLVYKYPKTTTMLVEWLGLDMSHHAAPMSHFDPRKSINNTRLWEEFPEYGEEIEMIENRLKEYLYDYSGVDYEEKNSISNKSSTIF